MSKLTKGYIMEGATIIIQRDLTALFKDLQKNNFWCYQGDNVNEVYPYLKHLRIFFSDIIKKERFEEYEPIIKGDLR